MANSFLFSLNHHSSRPGEFLGSIFTVFDAIIFRVMSRQVIAPNTKPLITKYAEWSSLEVQKENMADARAAIPKIIVLYLSITKHSLIFLAIFVYSTSYLRQRTFPKQLNISRMSAYRILSSVGS